MNWRRGLFRLWIVGSALFVLAVAFVSYGEIKKQFDAVGLSKFVLLPVLCGDARGVAGEDYTTKEGQSPGPWDSYANPNSFDNCWYGMSKFRPLYPEYNDLSDNELRRKQSGRLDTTEPNEGQRFSLKFHTEPHPIRPGPTKRSDFQVRYCPSRTSRLAREGFAERDWRNIRLAFTPL